jgi:hypothetical protein
MKFILWPTRIPQIAALSASQRKEAWRNAQGHMYTHWETWIGLLAAGLLAGAGGHVGTALGGATFGSELIGVVVGGAVGGLVYSRVALYVVCRYHSEARRAGGGA